MNNNLIIEQLKKQIESFKKEPEISEVGRILTLNDGVCSLSGLKDVAMGELVLFAKDKEEIFGVVLNLEEDLVGAIILGDFTKLKEGDIAKRTKKTLSIGASKNFIGRVINPLGQPLDKKGEIKYENSYPLEKIAPGVLKREPVNTPLHTGIKSIDSMIPIGRGQRELIIGDRQIGKTALAIDAIINQKQDSLKTPVCIYVAIGQKSSKIAGIVEKLKEKGAMDYSVVVSASASDPAPLWYIAPYAGCALAEYFMDKGDDVLIIYDDLSKHAWAYRQISLLLRRPPGREAYPGDIFYLHSRLLERSAKLNPELGNGSITALPIVETQAGDVSAYIPTNIISITDGQIYLEPELFYQGIRPALNVGLSVSRVGSAAQTKAMKKVAGQLRLDLAQFRELASFVQFGSDLDEATKQKIDRGQRITEILKQGQYAPLPFEKQVSILYAATQGMLDDIEVSEIKNFENKFLEHLENQNSEFLKSLRKKKDLTDELEKNLKNIIENFKKVFRK
ncbi:MAG: F0F1 ATP synthase subunit alpha [Candidatus Portnoybacteria bacterium RIFCSPLOWO2_12_FULL_39_9]|uniref:ATP synthase subunit alpha n=1 Tax=Candidatus Portnoybacteria bacterium RIFCSPHIGHO2_12_FULL_38_9 TaxID=1801997 RepID=A0A1G2FHT2_9BACT|nr:MAG: F0F1 ATP synthase subunit alpha [Candidatus Portnoybacteria bacterium RBG_13_40_8]OGZ37038.1 MAG: F0F1 ATP synthase subunit alpha [Candidatus Portnoybacteria bacterium RIFCSPHIGHO2_02_FULL_39_12]OGZ37654.1 MAG: F0F1 ATP synthase subunit alpha [Candidatus Portnoybacteria bacterium RIFCSPHIGHO2_12_FULL_38_9]OGZ37911.1 MAG: F0F1 ATP synthase subunit alpha [Candidatus Portnoybacteria bacterium RIFCSPLOWO2_01_FULL_38_39]OGZ40874.1 MAG: F0F1 ATP synthase subunit alpha [Candidatus Portnoybacte